MSTDWGLIGSDTPIDDLLAVYFPNRPGGMAYQLAESEEAALLAAVLLELREEPVAETSNDASNYGVYYSKAVPVNADGPVDPYMTDDEGRIDFGFSASSVDLRFSDDVVVAFKPPNRSDREILYRKEEGYATDIPARSRYLWLKAGPNAESEPTVLVEAWE